MSNIDIKCSAERKLRFTQTHDGGVYILGSFNVDIVSEVEDFPKVGQTVHAYSTNFYPGGKGANQAAAAAKLSDSVHFSVKIGMDEFGDKAKTHLSGIEINSLTIFEDKAQPTGNAIILVSQKTGDNVITIDLGANETITREEIQKEWPLIQSSAVFLTQLENNFDITKTAVEYASASNTQVILNPAPYTDRVKELLPLIDIITPNETEAQDMAGIAVTNMDSVKEAAHIIHTMGAKNVIITLGSKGCLLFDGKTYTIFPPYKAVVVDTSGAGDSFNGSLASSLANGKSLHQSIRYASAFSSLAVEQKGASNMPDDFLVQARLQMNK